MTFDELVKEIQEYDSDTFCAADVELTDEEARYLAEEFIEHFVENGLDGVKLDAWLYDMRCDRADDNDRETFPPMTVTE